MRDTFLDKVIAQITFRSECAGSQRHVLFRLRIERRILDKTIDKKPKMLFNLMRPDRRSLILLLDFLDELRNNLLGDMFNMCTPLCRRNTIDKTDLIELSITQRKRHFPTIIDNLMHNRRFWRSLKSFHSFLHFLFRIGRNVHINVLFKVFDFDTFTVEIDFDALDTACQIVYSTFDYGFEVRVERFHAKTFQVWFESYVSVLFSCLVGCDFGFSDFGHVVCPCLNVFLLGVFIGCVDGEFSAEDVTEFSTITVSATDDFFLAVVVIARREKMAKDQLGDIDFLFLRN